MSAVMHALRGTMISLEVVKRRIDWEHLSERSEIAKRLLMIETNGALLSVPFHATCIRLPQHGC